MAQQNATLSAPLTHGYEAMHEGGTDDVMNCSHEVMHDNRTFRSTLIGLHPPRCMTALAPHRLQIVPQSGNNLSLVSCPLERVLVADDEAQKVDPAYGDGRKRCDKYRPHHEQSRRHSRFEWVCSHPGTSSRFTPLNL